jgi:hypothetical protein
MNIYLTSHVTIPHFHVIKLEVLFSCRYAAADFSFSTLSYTATLWKPNIHVQAYVTILLTVQTDS